MQHNLKLETEFRPQLQLVPAKSAQPDLRNVSHNNAQSNAAHSGVDLILITARRCSSFFAEAAVLVLVFGILDYFMLKGRIELPWIVGALAISLGLLTGSIAMDFTAQRWIKSHP